jgi:beta-glucosidase
MSPEAELRRQVASLLVVRGSGHAEDRQRRYPRWELPNQELRRLIGEGIGGVILLGGSSTELQQRCQTLQSWAREPLLLCADVEEGVGQRFEGGTWLVPPMALGRLHARDPERAIALAERYGRCTGRQARRCGLNWVLAPVADVNNNPGNPVINVRAWGDSPDCVKALACAFQRGLASTGVLGCAKHFPGHGDTGVDSHLQLPVLRHDKARLERVELPPFAQLIQTGVDSVMTAHLLIPALDPELPATLSRAVLTNLLRDDLGFQGLVVTDALVMEAISKRWGAGEAARLAFAAGADLILMPADADAAIEAIVAALQSGVIPREHLETALARRQQALQKVAAAAASGATGEGFQDEPLELDGERSLALELIQLSLETQGPLPLPPLNAEGINLLRVDTVLPSPLLRADAPSLALAEAAGYRSLICHPQGISPWQPGADENPLALERLGDGNVLLQLFLRGNPFRGERDRAEPWSAALRQLQRQQRLAGLVVYGCPYTWANLRRELEPQIPAVYAPGQMAEAQQAALSLLLGSSEPSAMAVEGFTD